MLCNSIQHEMIKMQFFTFLHEWGNICQKRIFILQKTGRIAICKFPDLNYFFLHIPLMVDSYTLSVRAKRNFFFRENPHQ